MDRSDLGAWFARRGLRAPAIAREEPAALPGFRPLFNYHSTHRGAGAANLSPAAGSLPWAELNAGPAPAHGLAQWITPATLDGLDQKEGYPLVYGRTRCRVRLQSGADHEAWVYTVTPGYVREAYVPPSGHYLDLLRAAAHRHGFPGEYRAWLDSLRTAD